MNLQVAEDLAVLVVVLSVTAISLYGCGKLTWKFLGMDTPSRPSALTVWLGLSIVIASVEVIHLFAAINWKVSLAIFAVGMCGIWLPSRQTLTAKSIGQARFNVSGALRWARSYLLLSLLAVVVLTVWCLRAMEAPMMHDSGLYHFGSIRWLNEFAVVPGLGNLHWRLALNQSYFGFLALLNIAPFWGKGYAAGGLFLLVLTAVTLFEVGRTQSKLWRLVFGGVLFSYLCLLSGPIANPLPDTAIALLQVVIFIYLYQVLNVTSASTSVSIQPSPHAQVLLIFLCLTIVTVKLSSLGFALAVFIIIAILMLGASRLRLANRVVFGSAVLLLFFSLIHIGRGYLLSGAPFFPSPIGGFWSLPWAVHIGVAQYESQLIYAWAKQPGIGAPSELVTGFGWIIPWLDSIPLTAKALFVVSSCLAVLTLVWCWMVKQGMSGAYYLLAAPIFTALVFWFFSAPDPRFLGAILILYFVWASFYFLKYVAAHSIQRLGQNVTVYRGVALLSIALVASLFMRWSVASASKPVGWAAIPVAETIVQSSDYGVKAFVPINAGLCWDAELPCAALLHTGLVQAPMLDLSGVLGFKLDRLGFGLVR